MESYLKVQLIDIATLISAKDIQVEAEKRFANGADEIRVYSEKHPVVKEITKNQKKRIRKKRKE